MYKVASWCAPMLGQSDTLAIKEYDSILILPLKLYHYAYQKFNLEKEHFPIKLSN